MSLYVAELDSADALNCFSANGAVERYRREDGDGGLIVSATAIPNSGRAVEQLFAYGRYGTAGGPWVFHVALRVPVDYRNEFLAWYETEHLQILLKAEHWGGCRFVEERVADGLLFHVLHQLDDLSALDSEQRKESRSTPWFKRLSRNEWFDTGFVRKTYRRV